MMAGEKKEKKENKEKKEKKEKVMEFHLIIK